MHLCICGTYRMALHLRVMADLCGHWQRGGHGLLLVLCCASCECGCSMTVGVWAACPVCVAVCKGMGCAVLCALQHSTLVSAFRVPAGLVGFVRGQGECFREPSCC